MNRYLPLIRPAYVRLYLLLLQSMFIVLYAFHLVSPLSLTQALGSVVVAT